MSSWLRVCGSPWVATQGRVRASAASRWYAATQRSTASSRPRRASRARSAYGPESQGEEVRRARVVAKSSSTSGHQTGRQGGGVAACSRSRIRELASAAGRSGRSPEPATVPSTHGVALSAPPARDTVKGPDNEEQHGTTNSSAARKSWAAPA